MPESPLYNKPRLKPDDIRIEDLIGIAHPHGGTSDDMAMSVMDFAEAIGVGTMAHNRAARIARVPVTHQQKNVGFMALQPLPPVPAGNPPPFLTAAKDRANALKADAIKHAASVGTRLDEGAHQSAGDTSGLTATATDLASTNTLAGQLETWFKAHGARPGVHFHDDPATAGYKLPINNPKDLGDTTTNLNHLLAALQAHAAYGVA